MMLKTLMIVAYLMSHSVTAAPAFVITSPAVLNTDVIPQKYTCHGRDISLPVRWSNLPRGTRSLALIIVDEDVHPNPWYHWAVYNIPPSASNLKANATLVPPMRAATNSWGKAKYQGPCPPSGEHHYFIRLYALDAMLPATSPMAALQLRRLMHNHVIETAEIMTRAPVRSPDALAALHRPSP